MVDSHHLRHKSIHQVLGAGSVADVLLWRKCYASVVSLVCSTSLWLIFTFGGYNPLSFLVNVVLLIVIIIFFWAKSAALLNRPLPPIPDLEVCDKAIDEAASVITLWVNGALDVGHQIAVCGNLRILLQVAALLWLISFIGSLCNLTTFAYIGFLLALSVPVLYEKYQDRIDDNLLVVCKLLETGYRKLDRFMLRKIPVSLYKKKKKAQ